MVARSNLVGACCCGPCSIAVVDPKLSVGCARNLPHSPTGPLAGQGLQSAAPPRPHASQHTSPTWASLPRHRPLLPSSQLCHMAATMSLAAAPACRSACTSLPARPIRPARPGRAPRLPTVVLAAPARRSSLVSTLASSLLAAEVRAARSGKLSASVPAPPHSLAAGPCL